MTYPERIAREFHDTCERLAPEFDQALPDSWVTWEELTEERRALLVAVVQDMRSRSVIG